MNAIDTNVWIYCYDHRDPVKQQIAKQLVSTIEPLVLLWQVGCEFIAAARKLEPLGFTGSLAWEAVENRSDVRLCCLPGTGIWALAKRLQEEHSLHFWDRCQRCMFPCGRA